MKRYDMNMRGPFWALGLAAVLTACSGSSSSADAAAAAKTDAAITQAATETARAVGATPVSAPAGSTAYHLVADIGDSLTITFNHTARTYTIKVDNTQYGFVDGAGTFTSSTSGSFTTHTLDGGKYALTVDSRTQSITGNMSMTPAGGTGKAFSVVGTGYQISDLSNLAGTYNVAGSTRNLNGGKPVTGIGQLKIADDGNTAIFCDGGTVNASGTCGAISPSANTPALSALSLAISNGSITASNSGKEWGTLRVHTGDLGLSLLIDRYGVDSAGNKRVGVLYAVKAKPLAAGSANGTWVCSVSGTPAGSFTISSGTKLTNEYNHDSQLYYNEVILVTGSTPVLVSAPGFFTGPDNFLPLSSSFLVGKDFLNDGRPPRVCVDHKFHKDSVAAQLKAGVEVYTAVYTLYEVAHDLVMFAGQTASSCGKQGSMSYAAPIQTLTGCQRNYPGGVVYTGKYTVTTDDSGGVNATAINGIGWVYDGYQFPPYTLRSGSFVGKRIVNGNSNTGTTQLTSGSMVLNTGGNIVYTLSAFNSQLVNNGNSLSGSNVTAGSPMMRVVRTDTATTSAVTYDVTMDEDLQIEGGKDPHAGRLSIDIVSGTSACTPIVLTFLAGNRFTMSCGNLSFTKTWDLDPDVRAAREAAVQHRIFR